MHVVKDQQCNHIPLQTKWITLQAKEKKYWSAILRKSTTRLSEECLFSVIFMNKGLRKVKEIANWISSKLEPFERCFGHELSCVIFMNIGLHVLRNCGLNLSN